MIKRAWQAVLRMAYGTVLRLATPLYLLRLWRRGADEPGYRAHLAERLGFYRGPVPTPGALWLHAVSMGEARAAAPLVAELRAQHPGLRLLFTHGTATGRLAGQGLMQAGDQQVWMPYDTPGATRRFLKRHRPMVGVLMETEIWPSLMHAARRADVPMVLANARLSERSQRKGARFANLLHPAVSQLSLVLAQTVDDANRLRAVGAHPVMVSGNLKFDMHPDPVLLERGLHWRQQQHRPVVLAASTRDGEESMLLQVWTDLPQPRPLLLLVPRHPQRFDAVADEVLDHGLRLLRRSQWGAEPPADAGLADVWLGDSLGEMALYYACADVALLGGSFAPMGGQNLIEAAACGCPVVMGPHTFNFEQASRGSLAAGAGLRKDTLADAVPAAVDLAQAPDRNVWVDRALSFAAAHRGAAKLMAQQILQRRPGQMTR